MCCDLAHAEAFVERYFTPHVPVLAAFGGGSLHVCRLNGTWDVKRAATENADALFRSIHRLSAKDTGVEWDDLTFRFGAQSFLYADANRLVSFASTATEAEQLIARFSARYYLTPKPAGGTFHLIQEDRNSIGCHEVTLPPNTLLSDAEVGLHYGAGSQEWHQGFIATLSERSNGLSIFEGPPGTGKTCYLRHLMGVLKESHRFYFIPTTNMSVLSRPDLIGFWADQRRLHSHRRFVVVLEDSDAALMTRGSDNREQVSAILNLSDGMLADFLRLQIICTINCSAADIDPALLRPGRLLCHRIFRRLEYAQAVRLAESLGRNLPVAGDYSLAEVFAGPQQPEPNRRNLGFRE